MYSCFAFLQESHESTGTKDLVQSLFVHTCIKQKMYGGIKHDCLQVKAHVVEIALDANGTIVDAADTVWTSQYLEAKGH